MQNLRLPFLCIVYRLMSKHKKLSKLILNFCLFAKRAQWRRSRAIILTFWIYEVVWNRIDSNRRELVLMSRYCWALLLHLICWWLLQAVINKLRFDIATDCVVVICRVCGHVLYLCIIRCMYWWRWWWLWEWNISRLH